MTFEAEPYESLDWLEPTLAADAAGGEGALPLSVRPLAPDYRLVGRVTAVTIAHDDNLDLRRAVEIGPHPGAVLLVGGGGKSFRACMGGLMAREMLLAGFTALITNAPVRDAAEIRASGLLVWSGGLSAVAPRKRGGGGLGAAIFLLHEARDGDIVIAGEDGVVIWPWDKRDDLLAKARARLESDTARARDLDARLAARNARSR